MRRVVIRFVLLCLACAAAVAPRAQAPDTSAQTPEPQAAPESVRMLELNNLLGFSGLFNLGRGTVRALVILSPTCPRCAEMASGVLATMGEIQSKRLRAYIVFTPMLAEDTRLNALVRGTQLPTDRRAALFWDPEGVCAAAWAAYLDADSGAAGAALLYDADAKLGLAPPDPLWMQRHRCVTGAAFNREAFAESARVHVDALEAQARREQAE